MAVGASIGERIKHLQKRKGMTDTELAKVLHIDRATLKRIIGGDTEKVSSQVIIDAAQHFGVSTDKSLVANICTPEQRLRFIDLMEEILSEYGGEDGGTGTVQ